MPEASYLFYVDLDELVAVRLTDTLEVERDPCPTADGLLAFRVRYWVFRAPIVLD